MSTFSQVTYLEISAEQAGQRIDNFLHTYFHHVPRSVVYRILRGGEVRVNKGRVKPTYRLQAGDSVRIPPVKDAESPPPATPSSRALEQLRAAILYEDKGLIVLNKPAGMAVHGGSGVNYGVIEGLRAIYPTAPFLELVHRLDRDTSGCLMIAKKSSLLRRLHEQLRLDKTGGIQKQYLALVKGRWSPKCKEINAPLLKNTLSSGERMVRISQDGKEAISRFNIEQTFSNATLVRVEPVTGRTHQIRVHSLSVQHPVAGDEKYGDAAFNQQMAALGLKRLFLHSEKLIINLPDCELFLTVEAELPPELAGVLPKLA